MRTYRNADGLTAFQRLYRRTPEAAAVLAELHAEGAPAEAVERAARDLCGILERLTSARQERHGSGQISEDQGAQAVDFRPRPVCYRCVFNSLTYLRDLRVNSIGNTSDAPYQHSQKQDSNPAPRSCTDPPSRDQETRGALPNPATSRATPGFAPVMAQGADRRRSNQKSVFLYESTLEKSTGEGARRGP